MIKNETTKTATKTEESKMSSQEFQAKVNLIESFAKKAISEVSETTPTQLISCEVALCNMLFNSLSPNLYTIEQIQSALNADGVVEIEPCNSSTVSIFTFVTNPSNAIFSSVGHALIGKRGKITDATKEREHSFASSYVTPTYNYLCDRLTDEMSI